MQADYLFGRPVAERPAALVARIDPVAFQPSAYRDWTFGDSANSAEALGGSKPLGNRAELPAVDLDANGHARWDLNIDRNHRKGESQEAGHRFAATIHSRQALHNTNNKAPDDINAYTGPWRLSLTGSVTETGGRAVTATRQVEVDPVPYYPGLRRETPPRGPVLPERLM